MYPTSNLILIPICQIIIVCHMMTNNLIINDNLGVWEADDEDDLVEEITANAGWCIKSLNYEIQLK